MMKQPKWVLLIVQKPGLDDRGLVTDATEQDQWKAFQNLLAGCLKQSKEHERLTEGVALLSLAHGLRDFLSAVQAAEDRKFPYRILFFDDKPDWMPKPPGFIAAVKV